MASRPAPAATGRDRSPVPSPPALQAAAELALVGLTVAAVIGLGRLFSDASYLPPVLTVLLAAHALAWGTRRLGLGPLGAVLVSGVGLVLVVAWVVEPATTTMGLPRGRTWAAVGEDLRAAWATFGEVRAPADVTRGFVLAAAIGAWVAAFAADTFAFRAGTRFEAVVPSFVLFMFGALLGADRGRLVTTGLYLGAVLVFMVLSEASRRSRSSWFAGRSADGERALARAGIATALVGVTAALVVGPRLPGARSEGLVRWRDGAGGSSSRVTPSPLVDIRSRLVDQSNIELFTVRSSQAAYWRLTSLERYDGNIWSSSGSFEAARGDLPRGAPSRARERTVTQQFDVKALSAIWLPAAYRPQTLSKTKGVRFNEDSSSLLTDAATSDGLRYSVVSALPQLDGDELAPAAAPLSGELGRRYLALPADFPERVRREARRVTSTAAACPELACSPAELASGQLTPFHTARALQDWFRTNFTYSLDVIPGHGESAIEAFLFRTRRGYCEQFAGSFAAMARSVGLPSRVAVGFTPGARADDGTFRVTAKEAHAWPEVHIPGFGWVAFEPTPTRAVPGGESYTGVTGPAAEPGSGSPTPTTPTAPTTVAPSPAAGPPATPAPTPPEGTTPDDAGSSRPLLGVGIAALILAALAYLVGVPAGRRARRGRRRAAAGTPTSRVLVAWQEAEEDLRLAGLGRRPAETGPEYVQRLQAAGAFSSLTELDELSGHRSAAAYSLAGVDEPTARRAEAAAAALGEALRSEAPVWRRAKWALDPRPLLEAARGARESRRERNRAHPRRSPRPV